MSDVIVGVIAEVFNAVDGEGYTRDYDDPLGTFWLALRYTADVNENGAITRYPVNVSSIDRYRPPTRVVALGIGTEIEGRLYHDQLRWKFSELLAIGCET